MLKPMWLRCVVCPYVCRCDHTSCFSLTHVSAHKQTHTHTHTYTHTHTHTHTLTHWPVLYKHSCIVSVFSSYFTKPVMMIDIPRAILWVFSPKEQKSVDISSCRFTSPITLNA